MMCYTCGFKSTLAHHQSKIVPVCAKIGPHAVIHRHWRLCKHACVFTHLALFERFHKWRALPLVTEQERHFVRRQHTQTMLFDQAPNALVFLRRVCMPNHTVKQSQHKTREPNGEQKNGVRLRQYLEGHAPRPSQHTHCPVSRNPIRYILSPPA